MNHLKANAWSYFGDRRNVPVSDAMGISDINPATDNARKAIFYKRVRADIIAMAIKGVIYDDSLKKLELSISDYA